MKFVAKTLYGLENVLAAELEQIGATKIKILNRAVGFEGDMKLLYSANYRLRTALSVLMTIAEFRIRGKDDLYHSGLKTEWDRFLDPDMTFAITPVVNSTLFDHSGYAGLVLKDAVADYFRKSSGRRPSVNATNPDVLINLHISHDKVVLSVDSSVIPLFKRGYRKEQATAPLNEVLAAGILKLSGWGGDVPLLDPMCGSGTIPVEAALISSQIAPGRFRDFFGFMRWKNYDLSLLDTVKREADAEIRQSPVAIYGSDILPEAVSQSRANIEKAGLSDTITISTADFRDLDNSKDNPVIFMNPPYGLRIQPEAIDELYAMIGTTLKHNFAGSTAWLITSNRESLKYVGLKPKEKHILFNGALECVLLKYEMYQGSRKVNPVAGL